jgi:hypothetical protein
LIKDNNSLIEQLIATNDKQYDNLVRLHKNSRDLILFELEDGKNCQTLNSSENFGGAGMN